MKMENQSRRIVDFPEQSEVKDGDKLLIDNEKSYTHSVPANVFAKETELSAKQDKLNTAQTNAVNSGITADKVAQIAQNTTDIAQKQDKLNTAQTNAVNSGITADKVTQITQDIAQNTTDIASTKTAVSGIGFKKIKTEIITCPGVSNSWEGVNVSFDGNFITASVMLWGNERADKTASLPALRKVSNGVATFGRYNATTKDTFLVTIYTN
jgi:hypothetical protein